MLNLSPGTTFNLPITFKPLESVIYNDEVHFQFHDTQHAFDVPIHGILPEYNLQLQETIDFGTCNAFETELREIELKNPTFVLFIFNNLKNNSKKEFLLFLK